MPPDPRRAHRERLRSVPSGPSRQPVVAEGDIAGTEDVWLLRLGGTLELVGAHAMVGGLAGGVTVGTTLAAPPPEQLYPQWALHRGRHAFRVLLAFLTAAEVDHIDLSTADGGTRRMDPVYRHPDLPVAFFLDDVRHVPLLRAASYDEAGELLATADLSTVDTSGIAVAFGADDHLA